MDEKLCKNCKWYEEYTNAPDDFGMPTLLHQDCCRPKETINLITGEQEYQRVICETERGNDKYCGKSAKYFEQKSKPWLRILWERFVNNEKR